MAPAGKGLLFSGACRTRRQCGEREAGFINPREMSQQRATPTCLSPSRCDREPQTVWLINSTGSFSVLEAARPSPGATVSVLRARSGLQALFSLRPQAGEGARELSGAPFLRARIPLVTAPLIACHLPKAPPPNALTLGIRSRRTDLGDTNMQSVAHRQEGRSQSGCCPASKEATALPRLSQGQTQHSAPGLSLHVPSGLVSLLLSLEESQ